MHRLMTISIESWPIAGSFRISRGSKTAADIVMVTLTEEGVIGRGECVPYPHYGESIESVVTELRKILPGVQNGLGRLELQEAMPAGAARNALDCAFWDLEAKRSGTPVWQLAGLQEPRPIETAYTLGFDPLDEFREKALAAADRPILKLKVGGDGTDVARVAILRNAAPDARIIVDANEAWGDYVMSSTTEAHSLLRVAMIEQPLPPGKDKTLRGKQTHVPLCADESAHTTADLEKLVGLYDYVNIKLDKAGGLTAALKMAERARALEFKLMVGCMVGTSLSMAPAFLVAQSAEFADLDGPLLLAADRAPGMRYEGSLVYPPPAALWG